MCADLNTITASNARILSALNPPPNVVVVGGTAGIGRGIALTIGKHCPSAAITIIGRNETAANEILSQLGPKSKFIRADVSLMSEIRAATKQINAVDILVLSQGSLKITGRTRTVDNIDELAALSYYGRVLFVQELLPLLRSSPTGGKVVFILNSVRGNPSKIVWDDMALEHTNSFMAAFNQGLAFTDLVVQHLGSQPENAKITFIHAYPGYVRTNIGDALPFWLRIPAKCMSIFHSNVSPEECAEYMIHGMFKTDKGYGYIGNKGEPVANKQLVQEDMAQKVWDHTVQMTSPRQ